MVYFKAINLLHLRGGVGWQPTRRFGVIGAVGYGIVLGDNPVEYLDPSQEAANNSLVNVFSPGGIEFSIGVAFGLDSK